MSLGKALGRISGDKFRGEKNDEKKVLKRGFKENDPGAVGPLKGDIETAQQQPGVDRTRHECLKARWRRFDLR